MRFSPEDWNVTKEVRLTAAADFLHEGGIEIFSMQHLVLSVPELVPNSTISFGYLVLGALTERRLEVLFANPSGRGHDPAPYLFPEQIGVDVPVIIVDPAGLDVIGIAETESIGAPDIATAIPTAFLNAGFDAVGHVLPRVLGSNSVLYSRYGQYEPNAQLSSLERELLDPLGGMGVAGMMVENGTKRTIGLRLRSPPVPAQQCIPIGSTQLTAVATVTAHTTSRTITGGSSSALAYDGLRLSAGTGFEATASAARDFVPGGPSTVFPDRSSLSISFSSDDWQSIKTFDITAPNDDSAEDLKLYSIGFELVSEEDSRHGDLRSGGVGLVDGPLPVPPTFAEGLDTSAEILLHASLFPGNVFPAEVLSVAFNELDTLGQLTAAAGAGISARLGSTGIGAIWRGIQEAGYVPGAAGISANDFRDGRTFAAWEHLAVRSR